MKFSKENDRFIIDFEGEMVILKGWSNEPGTNVTLKNGSFYCYTGKENKIILILKLVKFLWKHLKTS